MSDLAHLELARCAGAGSVLAEQIVQLYPDGPLRVVADRVLEHYEEYNRLSEVSE